MSELIDNEGQRNEPQPSSYTGKAKWFTAGLIIAGALLVLAIVLTVVQYATMPGGFAA